MKTSKLLVILLLCVTTGVFAQTEKDNKHKEKTTITKSGKDKEVISDAENAKADFIKKNNAIQDELNKSKAYVIFPNVGKGALIIGGASGNGVVYKGGKKIGMASMKQLDIGLQAGGEAYSELIIFNTDEAFKKLKESRLELTAGASAVVLEEGEAINAKYTDGIAVYVLPKAGLMVDASVGGQKFEFYPFEKDIKRK